MNRKKNLGEAPYSPPEIQLTSLHAEQSILIISETGADLNGSGVDETNADNNGENVW